MNRDLYVLNMCKSMNKDCKPCVEECMKGFISDLNQIKQSDNQGYYTLVKDNINTFIKIAFPIISIVGCIANILIIFVVLRLPSLRRSYTNFFLVNMALADLGVVVWCVNLTALQYVDAELMWVVGPGLCKLNHFIQILSYTASILLLMLMCLERYVAIIFPMKVKNMLSKRIYIILLIVIWLISIGFSIPSLFTYKLTRSNNITVCENTQTIDKKTYLISTFILLYILPLVVMGSLYGHICYNLVKSLKKITGNTPVKMPKSTNSSIIDSFESQNLQSSSKPSKENIKIFNKVISKKHVTKAATDRRRVIFMLIVIVVIFALCRLPRHIWSMMYLFSSYNNIILLIFPPTAFMFMYLSSAINPLIYFAFSTSFRLNLMKAMCCCCPQIHNRQTNALLLSNSKGPKSNTINL